MSDYDAMLASMAPAQRMAVEQQVDAMAAKKAKTGKSVAEAAAKLGAGLASGPEVSETLG